MVLWFNFDSLGELLTISYQVREPQIKIGEVGCIHCFVKLLLRKCLVAFSFESVRHFYS